MTNLPEWAHSLISPLDTKMGFEMHELSAERIVGSIPVEGNQQPFGMLHGGASGVLIETLASMGAAAHGRDEGRVGLGVDLNVTHVRPGRSGRVTGVATAVKLGRNVVVYAVEVRDDAGRLTATGRLTCQMVDMPR